MQTIAEIMTRDVMSVSPRESLRRAAQLMDEMNVGSLPVCDGERLVGMITDRDITVRATSAGQDPEDTHVEDVMTDKVRYCFEDQEVNEVMNQMADAQIRRIPVVSRDAHNLIGIVSLGDVATKHSAEVDRTLEKISTPSEPDRDQPGA
jgi:CBS domain-containing protein